MKSFAAVLFCLLMTQAVCAQNRPGRPGRGAGAAPGEPGALDPAGDETPPGEPELPEIKVRKVKVSVRRDRLILADGKEIIGSIVAEGRRAVIIITATGEETIPRERVVKIDRAASHVETLEQREYEVEADEGHVRAIVPVGLDGDEEDGPGPPGIVPGAEVLKAGLTSARLVYKPEPGAGYAARLNVQQVDIENKPNDQRVENAQQAFVTVRPLVTQAQPGGAWTVLTRFVLHRLVRGGVDVTKLEAEVAKTARIERSLSRAGVWQPGADKVSGAGADAAAFIRWLGYVLVPVPRGVATFGKPMMLKEVIPPAIARQMLPLPEQVAGLPWQVTGEYEVKGVATVGNERRALIVIRLNAQATGDGQYRGVPTKLRVAATAKWDLQFTVGAGRPAELVAAATTEVFDAGNEDARLLERKVQVSGGFRPVDRAAPAKIPEKQPGPEAQPAAPANPPKPEPEAKGLGDALDELMKEINRPGFFEEKP
jgi:hypothetical protein